MGLYPWQYITKPPFQFAGISIRNLAPLISPISTLGPPSGAAAQKVANAKTAAISLVMEPPGFKKSIAGELQQAGGRRQAAASNPRLCGPRCLSAARRLPPAACRLVSLQKRPYLRR